MRKRRENESQLQSKALILAGNTLALIGQQLLFLSIAMAFRIIGIRLSLRRDALYRIQQTISLRSGCLLLLLAEEKISHLRLF